LSPRAVAKNMSAIETSCTHSQWDQSLGEEVANSISHGVGLLAALIGAPVLMLAAWRGGDRLFFIGAVVFAAAMLLVYLGSTLYHAWPRSAVKSVLQRIDHSAIFLLIAGTYTPLTLGPLRGVWGWTILALIWPLAILGVLLKSFGGTQRRTRTSMALYLGMGWLVLFALRPLSLHLPLTGLLWLVAGGLAYTGGVFFFVKKRSRYTHFIWHLFVLLGTACHFFVIFSCAAV
jgi:hemolysin III